jgi:hypothetical protein
VQSSNNNKSSNNSNNEPTAGPRYGDHPASSGRGKAGVTEDPAEGCPKKGVTTYIRPHHAMGRLPACLAACLAGCLAACLAGCLAACLAGCLGQPAEERRGRNVTGQLDHVPLLSRPHVMKIVPNFSNILNQNHFQKQCFLGQSQTFL